MNDSNIPVLKVLVGSRAHGLATPESDFDYRGVFAVPTDDLFTLRTDGDKTRQATWEEGSTIDDTAWEVGRFLHLAVQSNPNILEVFKAPVIEADTWGDELLGLFDAVWHPKRVADAAIGYGHNQQKKLLSLAATEQMDTKQAKFAATHIRVLYNTWKLLTTGDFHLVIAHAPIYGPLVKTLRAGGVSVSTYLASAFRLELTVRAAAVACQHTPDLSKVNDYLIRFRRAH